MNLKAYDLIPGMLVEEDDKLYLVVCKIKTDESSTGYITYMICEDGQFYEFYCLKFKVICESK